MLFHPIQVMIRNRLQPMAILTGSTTTEINQLVYLSNPTGGNMLKAVLFVPVSAVPVPAVVVVHGSGGLWSSTDSTNTKMASQFKGWIDSFRVHKIAALFVDSYTPRGVKTFHDVAPPENLPIAAEFVRPRDAYTGLDYLRTLPNIIANKIALLGYSHGGTTVLSTMVDANAVAKATPWSVVSNNITYTDGVLAPALNRHQADLLRQYLTIPVLLCSVIMENPAHQAMENMFLMHRS
jgi:predicted dienelactone hydrolase